MTVPERIEERVQKLARLGASPDTVRLSVLMDELRAEDDGRCATWLRDAILWEVGNALSLIAIGRFERDDVGTSSEERAPSPSRPTGTADTSGGDGAADTAPLAVPASPLYEPPWHGVIDGNKCPICGRFHRRCYSDDDEGRYGALLLALAEVDRYAGSIFRELDTVPRLRTDQECLAAICDVLAMTQCVIADAVRDDNSPLWLAALADLLADRGTA